MERSERERERVTQRAHETGDEREMEGGLRIGLRRRQNGKSDVPAKQRGGWPKVFSKLKEKSKAAFFSPSENRCLLASTLEPGEREFVVDSGASMHMISKKDLNDAEMDTLSKSCSPTIVINRQWRSADA